MVKVSNILNILDKLRRVYPRGPKPWARRSDPYRTLIGTIMSAQTTDAQVDRVTPDLFRRYPTPAALARARASEVAGIIKPVGLHKAKAKNIIAAARLIASDFGGRVPSTHKELTTLPGVGRKTANVVLIKAFGRPAMPVDTHVFRVANRTGIAKGKTPEQVERGLERTIPRRQLAAAHFWLIHHGRTLCSARNPKCNECPISKWCHHFKTKS